MGDIDFEELDKAVNSLMGQTVDQDVSLDAAQASGVAASAPAMTPEFNSPQEPISPAPAVPTAPAMPAVERRTGARFMDVIPSSQSRNASQRPAPSAVPSRESTPLQPVAAPTASVEAAPSPVSGPQVDAGSPSVDAIADSFQDSAQPLNSPFLEGVEIDKRPLGSPVEMPDFIDTISETPTPADMTMPDPIDFAAQESQIAAEAAQAEPSSQEVEVSEPVTEEPLRPELSPEVLAVETMSLDGSMLDSAPVVEAPVEDFEPVAEQVEAANPMPVVPTAAPLTAGDIQPQYDAAPTDAPEPSAVFDAASDVPAAIAHPQKKKSGWSIVLWILLMVIVGVAGGVAVWYFLVK